MHNGRMGKRLDPRTVNRAKELFKQGLSPSVVASRLAISESMARNILRDMPKPQDVTAESTESGLWS